MAFIQKNCAACNATFAVTPDEGWKKICLPCWKEQQSLNARGGGGTAGRASGTGASGSGPAPGGVDAELARIKARAKEIIATKESQLAAAQHEVDVARAEIRTLRVKLQVMESQHRQSAGQFDRPMLERIRRLCHPDRHGGSEGAVIASQAVNAALSRMA
jgi:hypothetical protein